LGRPGRELFGLGFYSPERLEACLLARPAARAAGWEILAVGATETRIGRLGLRRLVSELERLAHGSLLLLARVAPEEFDRLLLAELGFEPGPEHVLFATEAKAA
jgi:hypothetical protein